MRHLKRAQLFLLYRGIIEEHDKTAAIYAEAVGRNASSIEKIRISDDGQRRVQEQSTKIMLLSDQIRNDAAMLKLADLLKGVR